MNYLLKNNKRDRGIRRYVVGALAILAFAAIFYFPARGVFRSWLWAAARPLISAEQYVSRILGGMISSVEDKANLENQNAALRQELDGAQAALKTLDSYKTENETLKNMLGRTSASKRVLAAILAKPNQSLYDTLVLDIGHNQGISAGDQVLSGDYVIGAIREVFGNYSEAVLSSAPGEINRALIGNTGIAADAFGLGNGNFSVKLPKEISVLEGDSVRMPGLNPKFFGTVKKVDKTAADSFQFILFNLPININSVSWVEVEIK